MASKTIFWVDVGMAAAIGAFVLMVLLLRDAEYFVPAMFGYMAALIGWAFLAELLLVRTDGADREESWDRLGHKPRDVTKPMTH